MSEVNINDFDFNVDEEPKKKVPMTPANKYQSYRDDKESKTKKVTIRCVLLLIIEITFILLALILAFSKAKNIILNKDTNKDSEKKKLSLDANLNNTEIKDNQEIKEKKEEIEGIQKKTKKSKTKNEDENENKENQENKENKEEKKENTENKEEKKEGVEDKEKKEGVEDKEKKEGIEDKEKKEGIEEVKEKKEGIEDKEKKEGVEDKEKKEGVEDKEEKKEGVEDKEEKKEGIEDKEKKEGIEDKEKKEGIEDKEKKEGIEDKEKKEGIEEVKEKKEDVEDNENKEGEEDKEEKKEDLEGKEEKKEGIEVKEKKEDNEDNEKKEGIEEKKEIIEDKEEKKEGVEDKEEKKEGAEDKEEKKEGVEDKENKENLFTSANKTNITNIENKQENATIIIKIENNTEHNEKKENITNLQNGTEANLNNKENITKIENDTQQNEKKENVTNLQNGTEANINNKDNAENNKNQIDNRYKIQNEGNQEKGEHEKGEQEKEHKEIVDLKVCVCTPARNANKYIREYIEYYEKLGVDKIFIYDNNDEDGENFKEVLEDYIEKDFVKIKDWRGIKKSFLKMMNKCYQQYSKDYDWIIFSEVDEFIHLKNYTNIKDFLVEEQFDKCDKVYLNYLYHTDNDLYHYEDKPVQERFPIVEPKPENKDGLKHNYVKSLLRGNLGNLTFTNKYTATEEIRGCNAYGEFPEMENSTMIKQDFENYYIDLYFSKSVDEFIDRLKDRDMLNGLKKAYKYEVFENYFGFNKMNISKIEYIENKTELNLTIYKNMLKENNKEN